MQRGNRKEKIGTVVSDKMDKTVIVRVERKIQHPQYGKVVNLGKRYYAHNENASVKVGDTVKIVETRPMSKLKRWRVVEEDKS